MGRRTNYVSTRTGKLMIDLLAGCVAVLTCAISESLWHSKPLALFIILIGAAAGSFNSLVGDDKKEARAFDAALRMLGMSFLATLLLFPFAAHVNVNAEQWALVSVGGHYLTPMSGRLHTITSVFFLTSIGALCTAWVGLLNKKPAPPQFD